MSRATAAVLSQWLPASDQLGHSPALAGKSQTPSSFVWFVAHT